MTTAVAALAAALLLAGGSALGYAPPALSTWAVSGGSAGGGTVNAVAVSGSTAYLGGNFSYIGPPTGSAAAFDTSSNTPTPSWPAISGSVYSIVADGSNGWYVGGDFRSIGTGHYDNLVHVKSDGTIDTAWQASANGPVFSLLLNGATLFAGGEFTQANGQARNHLASFTASSGALNPNFHPDVTGSFVWSMAIFANNLFFGGKFTTVAGQARSNAAAVDIGDGDLDNWAPDPDDTVYAVTSNGGGTIYIGGIFGLVDGQSRSGLAAVATNGTVLSWNPNPNPARVYSISITGAPQVIYVGGGFNTIGGQTRPGLAAISSTSGFTDATWNPGFTVGATAVYRTVIPGDGNIYAGGFFQKGATIGAADAKDGLAAFSLSGAGAATAWHPVVGGTVFGLAVSGTKVAAGGQFRTAGPQVVRRNNLGAIDLGTGQATSWQPYANNAVTSLALSGASLYVGGQFDHVTDADHPASAFPRQGAAAFDVSGTGELLDWDAELQLGTVNAVAVSGSTVYLGGTFSSIIDCTGEFTTRQRLAAFDATTGCVSDWNPDVDDVVNAIAVDGSTVFAGGRFTTVNGDTPRNRLAAFDATSGADTGWNPNVADGQVNAVAVSGSTLYAGGSFTSVGSGTTRWGAAAFELGGGGGGEFRGASAQAAGDVTAWDPHLVKVGGGPGTVNALASPGATVYLGGDFDFIGSCGTVACQGAAGAVNASTGAVISSWLPEPNGTVNAVTLGQDGVLLGGVFTAMGYPRPGATFATPEPAAVPRAGVALVRGLPEPPSNVSASPREGGATITFGPPPYTGGAGVTGYTVTVQPGGLTVPGASSPIQVNGLTSGTPYTFTVTATTSVGTSQPSAPAGATPVSAPSAPTNVVGTPGDGHVSVAFSAPFDGGSPITAYTVTRQPGNVSTQGTASPIIVAGLTNGTAYTFTVTATNAIGTSQPSAASAPVTPRGVPGAPTNVSASPGNGQATVSYTPPASNGSPITLYTAVSTPGDHTGTSTNGGDIVVNGLENGTSYIFTVTAANAAGTGPASAASTPVTPRTVPGAPTGIVATAGNQQATVAFTAPESDGGAPITDYAVTSSPGGITAHGTSSPIVVPGLTNGQPYTFKVTATNAAGPGAQSAASNAVTPGTPATAPGSPTNATATAGNGQATVSFTAPASNGGDPITGYTVTSSPGGIQAAGPADASPITVPGLTNGQAYTFTVTATNSKGTSAPSAPSNAVTPTTGPTAPGSPTGVIATAGNGEATVTFTAPPDGGSPITGYTVTSSGGQTAQGAGSPVTVDGLTNGASYTFTVTATNAFGTSQASGPSNAVTPGFVAVAPGAPTGVAATAGNRLAVVTFTPPVSNGGAAITSYRVTASPGGTTAEGSGSPIIVTGLTNGQAYTFTVTATNSVGTSVASSPVSNAVTPVEAARSEPPSPPAETPRPSVPAPPASTTRIPPPGH